MRVRHEYKHSISNAFDLKVLLQVWNLAFMWISVWTQIHHIWNQMLHYPLVHLFSPYFLLVYHQQLELPPWSSLPSIITATCVNLSFYFNWPLIYIHMENRDVFPRISRILSSGMLYFFKSKFDLLSFQSFSRIPSSIKKRKNNVFNDFIKLEI